MSYHFSRRRYRRSMVLFTAAAAAACGACSVEARGRTIEWTNAVNGQFSDPAKWTITSGAGSPPPIAGDTAVFNEPTPA
jgi:hypothetical protein